MSMNTWDAHLYDDKQGFVSDFGKSVVELLQPQQGERILDWGCGTGVLTNEIARSGALVEGMDASAGMIAQARSKYPAIPFYTGNGETFRAAAPYDAVFSNAALHWMKEADKVAESIAKALRPGGRFVAELGGKGNIQTLIKGIHDVLLKTCGIRAEERNPWYFPSIGEYTSLLEKNGFKVTYARHFTRPTPLEDGDRGMDDWLDSFGDDFFPEFSAAERKQLYREIKEAIRVDLFKDGIWVADYERLRLTAVKV